MSPRDGALAIFLVCLLSTPAVAQAAPTIQYLQYNPIVAGTSECIEGSAFGSSQGSSTLLLNGAAVSVYEWLDYEICLWTPSTTAVGPATFQVVTSAGAGNIFNFTVVSSPAVSGLSPTSGPPGTPVTISGSNFGATQSGGSVWFQTQNLPIISWSDSQIAVAIPSGATAGSSAFSVLAHRTWAFSSNSQVLSQPSISGVTPTNGPIGTRVTIAGSSFGTTQGNGQVQIGNQTMIVKSWSDSSVVATVPAEGATGNVVLTADSGLSSNGGIFTVTFGGPVLQLSIADAPLQVNLTSPQNLDWIHWGRVSATLPDRKGGIAPLISDYTIVGGTQPSAGSGNIAFSWSDGDHPPIVSETTADVEGAATGSGFQITIPADTEVKTLNLYAEVFFGQGQLQAALSDGSAAAISDQSVADSDLASKIYSIDFRAASPGQTLTVTFTSLSGFVGLQAATLTPHLPVVGITSPAAGQMFPAPGTVPFSATASQFDSSVTGIQATGTDGSVLQVSNSALNAPWGLLAGGHYSITATATDSAGLTNTSSPVETDVIGQGGSLSIQENVPSSPIDLDAQGTGDWVLWGPLNTGDVIINNPGNVLARKAGVAPLISNYKLIGNHGIHALAFAHSLDFTAASQNLDAAGSQIAVFGLHDGFEITAPADTTPRTLQLYVGVISGDLRLTGFLSDGSAAVATEIGGTGSPAPTTNLYTINYSAASSGQILTLRLTLGSDQGGGEAVLIGAALNGLPAAPTAPAPQIASISPSTAASDTQVTLSGTNFGATQGNSTVLFGQLAAQVVSWSNTSVTVWVPASIPDGSTVQVAVITAGGTSNAVSFTTLTFKIYPPSLSLVVGQSTTVRTGDSHGNPVTGLGWSSSDPTIVALSTDDPPLITALGVGSATIYAGDVPLPVTVYPGTSLPPGTVLWSVPPGPGATAITSLIPAVPSDSGADIFTLDNAGFLSAFSTDGALLWRVGASSNARIVPDFSGSAFVKRSYQYTDVAGLQHQTHDIATIDMTTGQLTRIYTFTDRPTTDGQSFTDSQATETIIPHPAGPLFVQDNQTGSCADCVGPAFAEYQDQTLIHVLDPAAGTTIADIRLENTTLNTFDIQGQLDNPPLAGQMIVAGDGNAYVPYAYSNSTATLQDNVQNNHQVIHLVLLRVSPDGMYAKTELNNWTLDSSQDSSGNGQCSGASLDLQFFGNNGPLTAHLITNADQGVAVFVSGVVDQWMTAPNSNVPGQTICALQSQTSLKQIIYVSQDSITSQTNLAGSFTPSLQREDGSYVGINARGHLAAIDLGGNQLWETVPQDANGNVVSVTPRYATADGGVIATSANTPQAGGSTQAATLYTVDQNGNVSGQSSYSGATLSWSDSWYMPAALGGISQAALSEIDVAPSFWSFLGGNPSATPDNGMAARPSIRVSVHEIAGANIDSSVITNQVSSALNFWSSKGGMLFSWKDNTITTEPNCLGVSQCDVNSPEWLLDIVSSNPFNPTVAAADKGAKLRVAYSRFHTPTGINIVYVNQIEEAYALDIPILGPTTQFTDVILSGIARPSFMGSTDLVMSHETGHAFGLFHNALPLNLMCTINPSPTGNALVDFFAGLLGPLANNAICGAPIERRFLTSHQKYCAQVGARKYYNPEPPGQTGPAPVEGGLLTTAHPAICP